MTTFEIHENLSNLSVTNNSSLSIIKNWDVTTTLFYDTTVSENSTSDFFLASFPNGYSWPHLILASVLVVVIMFIIILGNLLVVIAIATDRNLKSTQNWFIASLAVADSLLGLIIMPFSLANELMGYWYFGSVWCDLWKAIDVLLCTASINSICLISLDRYWSITRAVQYSRQRTAKRASLMIAAVWILSAIICVPPLIGWKNPLPVSDYPMCLLSEDIGYVLYSSMGSFYIPAVIMVFVYFKIYLAARALARRNIKKPRIICAKGNKQTKSLTPIPNIIKNNNPSEKKKYPHQSLQTDLTSISDDESAWPTADHVSTCQKSNIKLKLFDEKTKLIVTDSEDTDYINKFKNDSETDCSNDVKFKQNRQVVVTDTESLVDLPKGMTKDYQNNKIASEENSTSVIGVANDEQTNMPLRNNSTENVSKRDDIKPNTSNGSHVVIGTPEGSPSKISNNTEKNNVTTKKKKDTTVDTKSDMVFRSGSLREHERQKRKLAKARERRATIVLGLVMAAFIFCWFPFFTLYVTSAFCDFCIPNMVFAVFFWAGYCNSALNPIIYTIFNREFRQAFHRIIFRRGLCRRQR